MSPTSTSLRWTWFWPAAAVAVVFLVHGGRPTFWLSAFFILALLWPATLVAARLAGARVAAIAGVACTALLATQLVLGAPAVVMQSSMLERPFDGPPQAAGHTFRLPLQERGWAALWSRSPAPEAYLYLQVVTRGGLADPGLTVQLGEQAPRDLTAQTRLRPDAQVGETSRTWHRLPVSREALEGQPLLEVVVAPRAGAGWPPGAVGLAGGYSFRPTYPPAPSSFFDGETWSTEPGVVMPNLAPGTPGAVRYFIELRIIDPQSRRVLAIYY